jgi:hypothetical protein
MGKNYSITGGYSHDYPYTIFINARIYPIA